MSLNRPLFLLSILLLVFSFSTDAQRRKPLRLWEGFRVIPKAGVNIFYGDLVDESRTSYSGGIAAEKELYPYLSGRVQIMAGQMKGTQVMPTNNLVYAYFDNFYTDVTFGASFKPLELAYGYYKQRMVSPYVFAQLGVVLYNAKEYYGPASGFEPNSLWRETGMKVAPLVSGGLGTQIRLNAQWGINVEFAAYKPFTDLLDGHKVWYDNQGNEVETDAGDFYYTGTVGVSYLIKDNRWRNHPKYNRKAYMNTKKNYSTNKKKKRPVSKYKPRRR